MVKPLHVLILDDSEARCRAPRARADARRFRPTWERVQSARELEAALRRRDWDLVLSDYAMPSFTGLDALRIVQASKLDLPFIIISGTIGEDVAVDAMLAGAHDFMVKGRLARLVPAIHREVREARLRRERLVERARSEAERDRLIAELREAVHARDTFLALASHELKTPLTSMMLHIQGLQRPHRSGSLAAIPFEQLEGKIDTIGRQALRLASLTKNLLDVARITSGRLVLQRESLDLAALVHEVVDQQRELGDPGSPVNLQATPAIGSWDRTRLETVVANLLSNALKFGEGQPIEIVVSDKARAAEVRVCDHGIGITAEQQARIFEKFERAVPAEHYGGLGLGLWIVRQIVEAHAGRHQRRERAGERIHLRRRVARKTGSRCDLLSLFLFATALAADVPLVTASLVRARIDDEVWVGVHYEIAEGWHIYWENPGQSGLATTATLTGGKATGPLFPGPNRFVLSGGIVNNGYERETTLLFRVDDAKDVHVSTRWLVCREECVPGSADLDTSLRKFPRRERRTVEKALALVPEPVDVHQFPLPADGATTADVFPSLAFESSGATATAGVAEGRIVLTLSTSDALRAGPVVLRLAGPDELRYVQVFSTDGDSG